MSDQQLLDLYQKNDFESLITHNDCLFIDDVKNFLNSDNNIGAEDHPNSEDRSDPLGLSFYDNLGPLDPHHSDEGFCSDTMSLGSLDNPDLLEEDLFLHPPTDFMESSHTWAPLLDDDSSEMAEQRNGVEDYGSIYSSPFERTPSLSYSEYDYLLTSPTSSSDSDIPEEEVVLQAEEVVLQVEEVVLQAEDVLPQIKREVCVEPSSCSLEILSCRQASPSQFKTTSSSAPALRRSTRNFRHTRRNGGKSKTRRHSSIPLHSGDHCLNSIPSQPIATDIDPLDRIRTGNRKRDRGPKCWEFLARLLADESSNPSLIAWEDFSRFTFRIKKPHEVASMWGKRGKKHITYEHFARGLRYHYGRGGLIDVPEKKMVYAFGKRAIKFLNGIYTTLKDHGYDSSTTEEDCR